MDKKTWYRMTLYNDNPCKYKAKEPEEYLYIKYFIYMY